MTRLMARRESGVLLGEHIFRAANRLPCRGLVAASFKMPDDVLTGHVLPEAPKPAIIFHLNSACQVHL
jgi:hypothetical protein